MRKLKIGIVGCGAIGATLALLVRQRFKKKAEIAALCDTDASRARSLRQKIKKAEILPLEKLIRACDLVVEAASAQASFDVARRSLLAKRDVLVMSIGGILGREKRIFDLARRHKRRIYFPSGAICGLDGIRALSFSKINSICLTTKKPPEGLKGVAYLSERGIDLEGLLEDKVVFEGAAPEAVKAFPQNINVVALLSMAAAGQAVPKVRIIASPLATKNIHKIDAASEAAHVTITCENEPSPDNPKTSHLAVLSAVATIAGIIDDVRIGT